MQNRSLASQLYIIVVASALIAALFIAALMIQQTERIVREELAVQAQAEANALAESVGVYLFSGENEPVRRIIAPIGRAGAADDAVIFSKTRSVIAQTRYPQSKLSVIDLEVKLPLVEQVFSSGRPIISHQPTHIGAFAPVRFQQETVGVAFVRLGVERVRERLLDVLPLLALAIIGVAAIALLVAIFAARTIARPLRTLSGHAAMVGQGQFATLPALLRRDEIGALWNAFGGMVTDLKSAQQQVAVQQGELEQRVAERTATLEHTLAELRASIAEREQLNEIVRELATPIVPVLRGVLVMPMVGAIDTTRAEALLSAMLAGIEQHRARLVILDATGVPVIDTQVARVLLQAADAARLLGAKVSLVGLRPEVAQTIVGLGLDLSRLDTRADLESAVAEALGGR